MGQAFSDSVILLLPSLLVFSLFDELDGFVVGTLVALGAQGAYFVKFPAVREVRPWGLGWPPRGSATRLVENELPGPKPLSGGPSWPSTPRSP